jgi:prepilin-type N-terminal cleavage/methylation domain-containing protein
MKSPAQGQQGFSLVEMLMTAFILAVGIMGLTLLQMMSLKGARGGKSLATAVQVGEMVMDQIEMEGRLSWLNITASNFNPTALTSLQYVNQTTLAIPLTFTIKGQVPVSSAPDPADSNAFYTVNFVRANDVAAGTGAISDFTLTVAFSDAVNPTTNAAIPRTVMLTRRILHG